MSRADIAPLVLFDLDGTLVDSAPDLLAAANRLRCDDGLPPLALDGFRETVSRGGPAMLAVAYAELPEPQRRDKLEAFLAYYAQAAAVHSTPFAGVEAVLAAIEAAGARWGIVTNKALYLAEKVVAGMGWQGRCTVLVGGDSLPVKKPDPAPLRLACERAGVEAARCVYVGDDERDVLAARAAGIKSVIALWGYRAAHDDPRNWGGDALAPAPAALLTDGVLAPG